jgi:hypothetical protein
MGQIHMVLANGYETVWATRGALLLLLRVRCFCLLPRPSWVPSRKGQTLSPRKTETTKAH